LAGQIREYLDVPIAPLGKQGGDGRYLAGIGFQKEKAPRPEMFRRFGYDGPDKVQAVMTAVQGNPGLPADLRGQGF
jgi:hypothetical protein